MNKQIEIEDMAFDLCRIDTCKHLPQAECHNTTCAHCEAEALIKANIRKTSAVAREIFEEIEKLIGEAIEIEDKRGRNAWGDGDTSAFMTHQYTEEKLECLQTALAELKKKYESEGADGGLE